MYLHKTNGYIIEEIIFKIISSIYDKNYPDINV